nr:hypothetical protein L203_00314 [Cryptococcus depauperatus CBS 7841]
MDEQQRADNDALASAVAASARQLGLGALHSDEEQQQHQPHHPHHFHHALQQPDFSQSHHHHKEGQQDHHGPMDVHALDMSGVDEPHHLDHHETQLNLNLGDIDTASEMQTMEMHHDMEQQSQEIYNGRPPSIRKACDLCHQAKQKCSGDRPSCTRCAAGGWPCVYAPRQRRRTVPKDQKHQQHGHHTPHHSHLDMHHVPQKKRKLTRESLTAFGSEAMDIKMAMGMAMDMGLTGEEEGEEIQSMSDDQMLESIAIDGYLSDLPLATFVNNLPYTSTTEQQSVFHADDFSSAPNDPFPNADMDQHTTSALRDAIFSLNESSANSVAQEGEGAGEHAEGENGEEGQIDPHLALLDLTTINHEGENHDAHDPTSGLSLGDFTHAQSQECNHRQLVSHILYLLTQHTLDPKPGSNTPLTLAVFAPLARSLRLFHSLTLCHSCMSSPRETLPQLALLSRTTTLLTFPFPPPTTSSMGSSAQITIHGARLSGTGLSEAIENHIVGVVWDSWRASIREVFASLDKKAQDVITSAASSNNGDGQHHHSVTSLEKQRAGLMFQAVSRLVTAMDEVEGN